MSDMNEIDDLKKREKENSTDQEYSETNAEESRFEPDQQIHQAKESQKENKGGWAWFGGVVLILIGVYFLAINFTDFNLNNWWALFILIPAFASFGNAYRVRQEEGRLTKNARGSLIGGLFMTFVACVFLFNLDWGKIWPVFIIIAGIGALLNAVMD